MNPSVITVQELALQLEDLIRSGAQLLDVREAEELALASLPGFRRFSLSESSAWAPMITELLDPDQETIVLCHHGVRSAQMCGFLVQQGFSQVKNVQGGIAAYSQLDPKVPCY